jgi:hypothetical protein
MRLGGVGENSDIDDIRNLAREIGVADAEAALALVASFYRPFALPLPFFGRGRRSVLVD